MKVFEVVLRAYNGLNKELLPSTNISGGISYGIYVNKELNYPDVGFTNFYKFGDVYKLHVSRVKLDRVANESQPFYYYKYIKKGGYYLTYKGYAIAKDKDGVPSLINKYGPFIGNWNSVFSIENIEEFTGKTREMCVYNLPVKDVSGFESKVKLSRAQVSIQRYSNANYVDLPHFNQVYYYDIQENKFKRSKAKYVYLLTFSIDKESAGRYYDDNALEGIDELGKVCIKMGLNVIAPCI